jgi:imidazolonepropionase
MKVDCLLTHVNLATMAADNGAEDPLGIVEDGTLAIHEAKIVWVGASHDLPVDLSAKDVVDLAGRWATPGLIDCHTHLIYGGNRAGEWQARLEGATYAEIAAQGGGIAATVAATRKSSQDQLVTIAHERLKSWIAEGVTTIEIKSGYGLSLDDEMKMLAAARELGRISPLRVKTTFLGAHTVPPEFAGRPDDYVDFLIREVLPAVARKGLVDAVDVFCETIAFSKAQSARYLLAAKALGLGLKIHADQLTDGDGAGLAATVGALSADHLEFTSDKGVAAMAAAGTVAVLLPGAFYSLRETRLPPLEALRVHRVPVAIATDHNPGTSPCASLLLILNMACTLFRMTPVESLLGVTRHAAKALGMDGQTGSLTVGRAADIAVWDVGHVRELCYEFGARPLHASMYQGAWVNQPMATGSSQG